MKTTTIHQCDLWDACSEGLDWGRDVFKKKRFTPLDIVKRGGNLEWAIWVLCQLDRKIASQLACDTLKHILPEFEKAFPKNKVPRKAINLFQRYLKNKATKNDCFKFYDKHLDLSTSYAKLGDMWYFAYSLEVLFNLSEEDKECLFESIDTIFDGTNDPFEIEKWLLKRFTKLCTRTK